MIPNMKKMFAASWGTGLKWSSVLVTLVLAGVSASGFLWPGFRQPGFGFWLHALPPVLILAGALPFVVRGFTIQNGVLLVHRLLWDTTIPLAGLQSAEVVPHAMSGSLRTLGNGGAFSFTGRYWSKSLGHYRAFVNDWKRPVVLRWPERTIVLSCDDPEAFVAALRQMESPAAHDEG